MIVFLAIYQKQMVVFSDSADLDQLLLEQSNLVNAVSCAHPFKYLGFVTELVTKFQAY